MSKKITSFVVLLAVMLLTLPSHAQSQLLTRSAKNSATELRSGKKALNVADVAKAKDAVAKAAEAQLANVNIGNWDWAAHETAPYVPGQTEVRTGFKLARKPVSLLNAFDGKPANRAATTDAHGIITAPDEGETKYYDRAGFAFYVSGNQVYRTTQSGVVEVVEAADGVVYIKDIITRYNQGSWVKGTKVGNTITVEAGQPLYYSTQYSATVSLYWGSYNDADGFGEKEVEDIVFTIDGNVITLEGSSQNHFIAAYWDDDDSFSGYGDYETVWTLNTTYVPPTTDLIELPEGAEVSTWYNTGYSLSSSGAAKYKNQNAKVAFVGNDVYVSGIFTNFPTSWIKGTLSGTTVTFEGLQYVGDYQSLNIFALGATEDAVIEDFVMTYDATANTLTAQNLLFANAATDRVYYLEGYQDMILSLDPPAEESAKTGDPVDVLPYSNTLTTSAAFAAFGVLDANEDGKTWTLSSGEGAQYTYNSTGAADDWLVSPAIKLEAGRLYNFAIDAKAYSANYPEKFEVKIATEPKASKLNAGQVILPATTTTSTVYVTYTEEGFQVSETGYYHFGVHAISAANEWNLYVANFLVEVGADPESPAGAEDFAVVAAEDALAATVSFTAPTKKVNGEDLVAGDITKIDLLRDGNVITTFENPAPGATLTYTDDAEDLTIGNHTYRAVSYGVPGVGGKSEEITVFLMATLNVPVTYDLTSQDIFNVFQVINANGDNSTWTWSASYGTYYNYNSTNTADDYLISTGINLKKGSIYRVSTEVYTYSESYPEKFEILAGTEPTVAGLTLTAIPVTTVAGANAVEVEGEFIAPEDGVYYLAIHAVSDPDMWRLHVKNLHIEKGPEPTAPAQPTLTMTPGELGALYAEGTVTMPTTAINGNALSGNISQVDILCDGELLTSFYNVAPGAVKKILDDPRETGVHTYQAIPYNEDGVGQKSEKVTIFVGVDEPAPITNIAVSSPEAGKLTFTWDPVVGANGGYIDTENVTYSVVTLEVETVLFWTILVEGETLGTVDNATTATVNFNVDLGDPGFQYFGVKATVNGVSSDPTINYGYARTGAPQDLPIIETFANKTMNNVWFTSNASLYVSEEASDDDGYALALTPSLPQATEFMTVKLDLKQAANPTFLFDAKKGTSAADKMEIFALTPDGVYTVLETVTLTDEYQSFKVVIPAELKNVRWTHLGFKVNFEDTGNVIIDNIKILDFYQYDLSVAVSAPKTITAGTKAEIKATVKNEGENAITGYTVVVKAGEEVLLQQNAKDNLNSFETKEFVAEYESSIFDEASDVAVTATVIYANDLNPDNDEASTLFSIKEPTVPTVDNVSAWTNGGRIITYWTAPDANAPAAEEVTDDVEDYEEFATGGLDGDVHVGNIGEWTIYDGNQGLYSYTINGIDVPNLGMQNAWIVMNPSSSQNSQDLSANYGAYSGEQYFLSSSVYDENGVGLPTDHWLISPVLTGDAQTISFFAREMVTDYGAETFEILVSSTDTDAESFTLLKSATCATTEWTMYTFDLPAGTKYFAIRHTSNDVWALFIDDITYLTNGGGVPEIDHFNIYLDGEFKTKASVNQAIATIEGASAGSHTVGVSVVYVNGQESKPVIATVDVTTGLNQINVLTQPVDVYSLDGKLIRKQTTSFDGLKGVYVVNGKKIILK